MSKLVHSDKWGRGLFAVILSSAVEWFWLRGRAALPCSDEAADRPRKMMNHWLRGRLARGSRWSWGGCDWCWVLLQDARRAVVCPAHEATWPGSRASYLLSWWVLSWCVCLPVTPIRKKESRWPEWVPFIPVACCPVCSAFGWLAELVVVASRR